MGLNLRPGLLDARNQAVHAQAVEAKKYDAGLCCSLSGGKCSEVGVGRENCAVVGRGAREDHGVGLVLQADIDNVQRILLLAAQPFRGLRRQGGVN
jgi:hypothetical protein